MKKYLLPLFIIFLGLLPLYACNCTSLPHGTYFVKYIIDGKELYSAYAHTDEIIGMPDIEPREGYVFKGWYLSYDYIEKWDFENDVISKNTTLYAYWVATEEETFNVVYYDSDGFITYEKIDKGGLPTEFYPEDKFGYEFVGWKYANEFFDFSSPVLKDYALTTVWEAIRYSVDLIADGQVVEQISYTVEDTPEFPEVPEKQYYTGEWELFTKFETTEVNAIYKPIIYTATFLDEGKVVQTTEYTVEDTVSFPELTPKEGYTKEWDTSEIIGGNITVNSVLTPIAYNATFVADGITVAVRQFTVENKNFSPPPVPPRDGYEGSWENKAITAGDVVINAVYKIKVYTVSFVADGKLVAVRYYQIDEMSVTEPEIPEKEGFTARWESYELKLSDLTVNAEYIPITYYANFYADEKLVKSVPFTVDGTLTPPDVPKKEGFSGEWDNFTLSPADIDIIAIYLPILFRIKFVCDEEIIAEVVYTVEFKNITLPAPIEKDGYAVRWEEFALTYGDMTVNAVYTPLTASTDEFTYEEQADGTLAVTCYNGEETTITVPSVHDGKRVTAISNGAFMNGRFTSVTVSEGIERIGNEAFQNCTQLTEINLPQSLKSIGKYAFAFCGFEEIILPNLLNTVDEMAFAYSKLERVRIPDRITRLEKSFYECTSLTEIIFPASLTEIEPQAFTGCTSLERVIFEDADDWTVCTEDGTPIKELDFAELSDEQTAANYLLNIYFSRYWIKENG